VRADQNQFQDPQATIKNECDDPNPPAVRLSDTRCNAVLHNSKGQNRELREGLVEIKGFEDTTRVKRRVE
jgi:hypothetical protein